MRRLLLSLALTLAACAPPSHFQVSPPSPAPSPVRGSLFCLTLASPALDADYLSALLGAVDDWEAATSRPLFSWAEGESLRLVQFPRIVLPDTEPNKAVGGLTVKGLGLVILSGQTPVALRRLVVTHELGHVLGLEHSNEPHSIMQPVTESGNHITPNDTRRALEALAGR